MKKRFLISIGLTFLKIASVATATCFLIIADEPKLPLSMIKE